MASASSPLRIADLLLPEYIVLDLDASSRNALFDRCGELFERLFGLNSSQVATALRDRERIGSTGLGYGIAVPHARLRRLSRTLAAFVRTRVPIEFDAPDGLPVTDLIVLAVPGQATEEHLELLADAARLFGSPAFRSEMRASATPQTLRDVILRHAAG